MEETKVAPARKSQPKGKYKGFLYEITEGPNHTLIKEASFKTRDGKKYSVKNGTIRRIRS